MFPDNVVCLSDEELLFILNAMGEKGIPGLNSDILRSDTECDQKLLEMAGRVLIARNFIKSDGNKLEIAKELMGIIYATIYPEQMVTLTVQPVNMPTFHQYFFRVPEMLLVYTPTSGVNYFEIDVKSTLTAEPIVRFLEETLRSNGEDGQQFALAQKDVISIRQNGQLDTIAGSYKPSNNTALGEFSNTLKNMQVQMTLHLVYQLNPEVRQNILTIISDDETTWLLQADNPTTNNMTLQRISRTSLKEVVEGSFLNFATSDIAH